MGTKTPKECTYGPVGIRIVWGNANYGGAMPTGGTTTPDGYVAALQSLIDSGIAEVDTSRVYRQGKAEEWLGEALSSLPAEQQPRLSISTKAAPQVGPLSYEGVRSQAMRSMELLGVSQVRSDAALWSNCNSHVLCPSQNICRAGRCVLPPQPRSDCPSRGSPSCLE